jgi:hypothetical protein
VFEDFSYSLGIGILGTPHVASCIAPVLCPRYPRSRSLLCMHKPPIIPGGRNQHFGGPDLLGPGQSTGYEKLGPKLREVQRIPPPNPFTFFSQLLST